MFRRLTVALAGVALLAACQDEPQSPVASTAAVDAAQEVNRNGQFFTLTLLHNNDGESSLLPDGDIGGVARFAALVDELRAEGRECDTPGRGRGPVNRPCDALLVSSGDNFLAGPEFNASLELAPGERIYDARALDAIGYDAIAIGNHEFDFGPDVLARFIGDFVESEVPFLSANLDVSAESSLASLAGQGRIAARTVVETEGGPVGIIGATTPELATISSPGAVAVSQDVAGAINAEVSALEAEGVDMIILISHLQSLDEDTELIAALRGVDIVVAGGGDELLASPGASLLPGDEPAGAYPTIVRDAEGVDVPVVTTSGSYGYVGRLEVTFRKGEVIEISSDSNPVAVIGGAVDGLVESSVEGPVEASVAGLESNVIGITEVGLDGIRENVRRYETNLGSLIADGHLALARDLAADFGVPQADVALQNGGGIRIDDVIPAGDITELDTFETLPFSNVLTVVEGVTFVRFKEVLENAVSRWDFTSPNGRFAQVAGFRFEWDFDGTAQQIDVESGAITTPGTRVRNVWLTDADGNDTQQIVADGAVVGSGTLTVATINFLAAGGDQYPLAGLPATNLGVTYQQILETYIEDAAYLNGLVPAGDYPEGGEGRIVGSNLPTG